jgi:PAS domain S-box-containing protein
MDQDPVAAATQTDILERIATGAALPGTLDEIVRFVERAIPGAVGSVLLLDGVRLHGASCGGLPAAYNAAIEGIVIGPGVGSCGTAAATGEPCFVDEIATHPNWAPYAALAKEHGLAACWSTPIRSRRPGRVRVLGTFAVYFAAPRSATPSDRAVLARAEHLACIAIEAERDTRALRDVEARFRSFVEHTTDAYFVHDVRDSTILDVSARACESLGYTRDELLGQRPTFFDPAIDEPALERLVRRLESGELVTFESVHRRKDGTRFPVEIQARRFEHEGRWKNLAVARDITERRRLEEQLRHAQKMDAVGRLAGGIAHDFNNLLTVINSSTDLAIDALPVGAALREDLLVIRDAGERAARLTAQLLAFSRRAILAPVALDLNATIERMVHTIGRVLGERVAVVTQLDPATPHVVADPGHVDQVLLNLVLNARDAMPDGGRVTIRTERAQLGDARAVALTVEDTGMGMSEEVRARVFEPFFTTKGPGAGTGLGLATVYGIMAQSGGTIAVQSEPGRGSRFVATFPAASGAPGSAVKDTPRGGSETVLVVEDEPGVRRIVVRVLRSLGYVVIDAPDAGSALALEATRSEQPIHLLLTDVVMPGMGGRELADAIRARRPQLAVLFMSGYTDDDLLRHGVSSARDAFLQKPFTPEELAAKVRAVLGAASMAGASPHATR